MTDKNSATYKIELRTDEWALVRSLIESIKNPKVTYSNNALAMANEAVAVSRENVERLMIIFDSVWESLGYE